MTHVEESFEFGLERYSIDFVKWLDRNQVFDKATIFLTHELVMPVTFLTLSSKNIYKQSNATSELSVAKPNTNDADVAKYNRPLLIEPTSKPTNTTASIRAILLAQKIKKIPAWMLCICKKQKIEIIGQF